MSDGGRDCRAQFWKGITHGPFHQSLVLSSQVVSEKNIFSNFGRMDDGRKVMTKAPFVSGELKKRWVHIIFYPW
jgi:hypothetical protein